MNTYWYRFVCTSTSKIAQQFFVHKITFNKFYFLLELLNMFQEFCKCINHQKLKWIIAINNYNCDHMHSHKWTNGVVSQNLWEWQPTWQLTTVAWILRVSNARILVIKTQSPDQQLVLSKNLYFSNIFCLSRYRFRINKHNAINCHPRIYTNAPAINWKWRWTYFWFLLYRLLLRCTLMEIDNHLFKRVSTVYHFMQHYSPLTAFGEQ